MRKILAVALLAAFALSAPPLMATASAKDPNEVDCAGFEVTYDDHSPATKCYSVDEGGIQTSVKLDRIVVVTPSYELIFTYAASGQKTYLPIESLQTQVDKANFFADTDNWSSEQKYGGFDISLFTGTVKNGGPPLPCAIFARYSGQPGNYEFDGGPGYKNLAQGLYCALSGGAALMNPPENFFRVVQVVIGKLHMPN